MFGGFVYLDLLSKPFKEVSTFTLKIHREHASDDGPFVFKAPSFRLYEHLR